METEALARYLDLESIRSLTSEECILSEMDTIWLLLNDDEMEFLNQRRTTEA